MATRIRVRKGDTEVEYEGSEQFLKTELASLLEAASTFPAGSADRARPAADAAPVGKAPSRPGKAPSRKTGGGKSPATGTPPERTAGAKARAAAGSAGRAGGNASDSSGAGAPAASPTADIARKIGCKHGTDLVLAASAQLNLGAGQRSFSRAALLGEMKTARDYYQPVYGKNLSRYLRNLIKERQLNEPRPGSYALTAAARREMGKILAE